MRGVGLVDGQAVADQDVGQALRALGASVCQPCLASASPAAVKRPLSRMTRSSRAVKASP